jgi:hypothetical protein
MTKEKTSSLISNENTRALLLLENKDQVVDCLTWVHEVKDDLVIIALSPSAMYELEINGLSYEIPEKYYGPDELYNLGLNNFEAVEKICTIIDSEIQQCNPEFQSLNIKPALFSFYSIKIFYDAILIRIFQLSKICMYEKPSIIYVYSSQKYSFGADASAPYLLFNHSESLYSQLLALSDWNFSVKDLTITSNCKEKNCKLNIPYFSSNIKVKSKVWLTKRPLLYGLALIIQKKSTIGPAHWLQQNLFHKKSTPILLYGAGYNWDESYDCLIAESIHPIYRTLDNFDWLNRAKNLDLASLNEAWIELEANSELKHFFFFNNVDFSTIVKDRFEYLVKRMSIACLMAVHETMSFIEQKGIEAVISSTLSTCVGHSVAQAAHNSKIPVITWQHGGYGMTKSHPLIAYCDFINSDYHFVFGDGVIDCHHNDAEKYGTMLVSIGNSSLESMFSNSTNVKEGIVKRINILYATSSYLENDLNISTYPPISDNLFWRTQKSIVDLLGEHPQKSITIKLHPSTSGTHVLESYVSDKGYSNFTFIRNEKSFPELLQMSDMIVIDLPFTTILQALPTKKPIFVYTGHVHYNSKAHRLLSKRAICLQDLNEYLYQLDKYLDDGEYNADLNNTDFMEQYGLSSNKESSKTRAGKELNIIIDKFIAWKKQ